MLNIEKSSYEEQIWSHFFSSDEHPFQQKEEKYRYLCPGKVGGNMRVRLKGPNVDWDVQLLLKTYMRQQCAFLGRDLSCLLCFVRCCSMFILYKRKQPLLISFFRHHFSVHDYPIYSSKVHPRPSLHPFTVSNTPHITSRHKIYLVVRCINTKAISWWIKNPHALYSILKGLHQRWKEECCTKNDKIRHRRWSVGQR